MATKYYEIKELQELLNVSRQTLYSWIKTGKLQATQAGRKWLVTQEALDSFLAPSGK